MTREEIHVELSTAGKTGAQIIADLRECFATCGEPRSATVGRDRIVLRFPRQGQWAAA